MKKLVRITLAVAAVALFSTAVFAKPCGNNTGRKDGTTATATPAPGTGAKGAATHTGVKR